MEMTDTARDSDRGGNTCVPLTSSLLSVSEQWRKTDFYVAARTKWAKLLGRDKSLSTEVEIS